jgi:S1-C subfamily serine protease
MVRIDSMVHGQGCQYLHRGSGFFVDSAGIVATALHGLENAEIQLHASDGRTFRTHLWAADKANGVALLKIAGNKGVGRFQHLELVGTDTELQAGARLFGLGYPAPSRNAKTLFLSPGNFVNSESLLKEDETVSNVSSRRSSGEDLSRQALKGLMHTEQGMSGGPLLNEDGLVVGVLTGRRLERKIPVLAKATPVSSVRELYHSYFQKKI